MVDSLSHTARWFRRRSLNLDTASVFGGPLEEPLAAKCRSAALPGVPRAPPAAPRLAARPIGVARNDPRGAHLGSRKSHSDLGRNRRSSAADRVAGASTFPLCSPP